MAEVGGIDEKDDNGKLQDEPRVHEHQMSQDSIAAIDQKEQTLAHFNALNNTRSNTPHNKTNASILTKSHTPTDPATPSSSNDSWWKQRTLSIDTITRVASTIAPNRTNTYDHVGRDPSKTSRPWLATCLRFGPLSGIFCMLLAAASIVSSLGILAGSDKQPVTAWSSPPSTYLAIFTAIANVSMRYAAIQGVVIAWWLRACNGTTLSKLHWDWRSGTTLRGALTAGRHMGLLGLACVFSTLVVVDGPLLQRSSTVVSAASNTSVTLDVSMAAQIPTAFGRGLWLTAADLGFPGNTFSPAFNSTIPSPDGSVPNNIFPLESLTTMAGEWWAGAALKGVARGCSGTCSAKLQAPAFFPTACTTDVLPLRLKGGIDYAKLDQGIAAPLDQQIYLISFTLVVEDGYEKINLAIGYGETDHCEGTQNFTTCTLESGTGFYDLEIQDGNISLEHLSRPAFVALANNTAVNHTYDPSLGGYPSTLANFASIAFTRWEASFVYYQPENGPMTSAVFGGAGYETYAHHEPGQCATFTDPWDDIIQGLNRMAVYTGATTALDKEVRLEGRMDDGFRKVNYTTTGFSHNNISVFQTNYWFFLGAALVELVCICLVAPTFWGWWRIGRPVSFSPLEMAKAFESPLLFECNSNTTGRDLAHAVGEKEVKYGAMAVDSVDERTKVAFGDPRTVSAPTNGMLFDI